MSNANQVLNLASAPDGDCEPVFKMMMEDAACVTVAMVIGSLLFFLAWIVCCIDLIVGIARGDRSVTNMTSA